MKWREVRLALVTLCTMTGLASAGPRPLAHHAMGLIGADMLHADLALTGLPLIASPTVSLLTAGIEVGTDDAFLGAPAESPIRKRARARREAEAAAPARRARRAVVRSGPEPEVRDEVRVAQPQPAAVRKRLFDLEEHSPFETPVALPARQPEPPHDDRPRLDRVSVRGEAMFLMRERKSDILLAQSVTPAGTADGRATLDLDAVQQFDGATGFRTGVLYRCNSHDAVELSYFGSSEWTETAQLSAIPGSAVQSPFLGATIGTADDSFDSAILASQNSQVHNGELNWLRAFDNYESKNRRYILGLRWFNFRDALQLQGTAAAGLAERTRVVAENDLVGPHIGVDYRHRVVNRLDWGFVSKAGLFLNSADQTTTVTAGPAPTGTGTGLLTAAGKDTKLAGLVDVLVQLMYRPWHNVMIRGGYQVLYAQQLALAPENLKTLGTSLRDAPNVPLPAGLGAGVDTGGTMWLDGAFVGGEVRF